MYMVKMSYFYQKCHVFFMTFCGVIAHHLYHVIIIIQMSLVSTQGGKMSDDRVLNEGCDEETQARALLEALQFDLTGGSSLELRFIGGHEKPSVYWRYNWDQICQSNKVGANIYFGVTHRDGYGGKAANCTMATTLWADLDGKDWNPEFPIAGKEAALTHLRQLADGGLLPSIIVDSGHGYHAYWLLRTPYIFSSDERRAEFVDVLGRLATLVKGDRSVADVARVMRLPGTMNTKDSEYKSCFIIYATTERKFSFEEFNQALPKSSSLPVDDKLRTTHIRDFYQDLDVANQALGRLNVERASSYADWIAVGMALHSIIRTEEQSPLLLNMWDSWSRRSPKYVEGICAEKWVTFSIERNKLLTVDSLIKWASDDSGQKIIIPGGRSPLPSAIKRALTDLGYAFKQNDMNDTIYVGDTQLVDGLAATIVNQMHEHKYKDTDGIKLAWRELAYKNKFHPIKQFLLNLEWDGTHRLDGLNEYFVDDDGIFIPLFKSWMIGAVRKILGPLPGEPHPMLVLDGPQGVGKSRFVWWLGSVLPEFYIAGSINPEDKDYKILQCSKFIWEVEELGGTLRRADREALKAFITSMNVDVRRPYEAFNIRKPVTCSYIGTINNENGFLSDPTGNRRFRIVTINKIDWAYSVKISVSQLWAEAVKLVQAGATTDLSPEIEEVIRVKNQVYTREDTIEDYIKNIFEFTGDPKDHVRMINILAALQDYTSTKVDLDVGIQMRVGVALVRNGAVKKRIYEDGNLFNAWTGIRQRPDPKPVSGPIDVTELLRSR